MSNFPSISSIVFMMLSSVAAAVEPAETTAVEETAGWKGIASRDEIKPTFAIENIGENAADKCLVITADDRRGLHGAWIKTFAVKGGNYYRFSVFRHCKGIESPRRSVVVKIIWQDVDGKLVQGEDDLARPEYPSDQSTNDDGWTEVADTYWVPKAATQARVELHLRWARNGTVRWNNIVLKETDKKPGRLVRLATVHFRPKEGKTAAEKCAQFEPLIAEAGRQKADLVCLPESLTYFSSGRTMAEVAEPIPGPSSQYFGKLAKKYDLYIVAGLVERVENVVYNTAVLIGPDGKLEGKYRKTCLPREEIEAGVTPGNKYPVFQTRFGKVGMMVCWDVHFPEVARNLSNNGAEVIALPIWGGNPALAKARAIENQIYLVSSTYTDPNRDWMKSGIWDHEGNLLTVGKEWGKVHVVEVDLDKRTQWRWLGDFKARIYRERPVSRFESPGK